MTQKQLEYFIAIATTKSVTKAAQKLYVSQPALSSHIKQLETELKTQLFIRNHRSIELTPAGELFLIRARELLIHQQNIINEIQAFSKSQQSNLRLGFMTGNIYRNIPDLLVTYKQANPSFSYSITSTSSSKVFEGVKNHTFDIGCMLTFYDNTQENPFGGLAYEELITTSIYAVLPNIHPFASKKSLTFKQLANETVISTEIEHAPYNHKYIIQNAKKFNMRHKKVIANCDISDALNMVRSNLGICFLAKEFLPDSINQLKFIPLKEQIIVKFVLIWDDRYLDPQHHQLIEHIKKQFNNS
ncbi:LysR family transcriptional regulator [Paenibacillus peoriae]|uniref:LysR family transcriptional regulator n=1 Tax=Paenibacillus peoriae TaxID=59893 RepID=UPI00026C657E|nr:LysR family transcriptional regulator [Paenibacillus peoriae]MEC0181169.1 LysR family transcriptional regulator [Paenibacillus peoriae]